MAKTVDDLLGEFQSMSSTSEGQREKLESHSMHLGALQEKLKDLDTIKEFTNKCVSTDAFKALEERLVGLKSETEGLKVGFL